MASRPKRSAATKATENISVQSKWADNERVDNSPVPFRRSGRSAVYRDAPSSPESASMPSRSRQSARAGRRSEQFDGGEIVTGKRNRGAKKSYVVDSSPEEDEEDELEDEVEVDLDEDAEGEDEVDMDAEGEDLDADGDVDMDAAPPPRRNKVTSIKVSRSAKPRTTARAAASRIVAGDDDDDDDDDELSEPDSDLGDATMGLGDENMADEDAEGEEIEVAGDGEEDEEEDEEDEDEDEEQDEEEDAEGEADIQELESDDDGSRAGTPDLAKMTKRQRARFDEQPQEYMKLSDGACRDTDDAYAKLIIFTAEVQAKKVFTAEELSMRRQEMARRRRNLSEKRNEEVKMETINKLLKKQAPKTSKKGARGNSLEADAKPAATLIRWVSNKGGSKIAVPEEIMGGPMGNVFGLASKGSNGTRMVEEVA
ncbi:hypothetical protein ISF_04484 [Cordyceps fumosorosea ARSEF 2679]|uniref:INO80 complex subunit B-like conserved region domain-containing protein n=1 Tax=Cordyceps fumosorosea (strain ARSEF 2679) TaxID=1081104 RepID=A0A167XK47_CORFA|nr:hypothetical protein ISF_04484 [Cordyceps fumosorosea ARSEF 2679]OAA65074.1 hypothetical protein ISF_04484 [Cordyceps fumosorosea ARSEF 2679]